MNNIKDLDFEELLNNPNFHYNLILKHEKIVKKFDEIITKYIKTIFIVIPKTDK